MDPERLERVELLHVRLPLVRPFVSARGVVSHKDALLVHVHTSDGVEGWGECAAELAPTYAAEFLDATRIVTGLLGDSLGTNIFLLGYAFQMGIVPVARAAIFRAIELNGAAVEANQRAFDWGRLAQHDPAKVQQHARPPQTAVGSDHVPIPSGIHERRLERQLIADYERTVATLEGNLRADSLALAVEIASLPATIRGYGHVKRRNIDAAHAREAALLAQYRAPLAPCVALAA